MAAGDSPQFLPPCDQGQPDPRHPKDTGESLVHDCYDPASVKKMIPPLPDLRSGTEKIMDAASQLLLTDSQLQEATHDALIAEKVDPKIAAQREVATESMQKEAWQDIFTATDARGKDLFPGAQATSAYYVLMRGYGIDTPAPDNLNPEQLRYVNNFGLSHSADDGVVRSLHPGFEHIYKPQ